ncbi:MAG: carotenoid biosynthesis protein [Conexivisphaerales archaeon]
MKIDVKLVYFLLLIAFTLLSLFIFDFIIFVVIVSFLLIYRWYGLKLALISLISVFLIALFFEILGVNFGIPFGKYYYSNILGVKLFAVPISVPLMWFSFIGIAYLIAGNPLIGALLPTALDLLMDPYMSGHGWFWQTKLLNFYYGIPLSNFIGWYFVSLVLIFCLRFILKSKQIKSIFPHFTYLLIIAFWTIKDAENNLFTASFIGIIIVGIFVILSYKSLKLSKRFKLSKGP